MNRYERCLCQDRIYPKSFDELISPVLRSVSTVENPLVSIMLRRAWGRFSFYTVEFNKANYLSS